LCDILGKKTIKFPDDCYQGDYIIDIAYYIYNDKKILDNLKDKDSNDEEAILICAKYAADNILKDIKNDLLSFGVNFDKWFSEQSLYDSGMVQDVIKDFQDKGIIYKKDGALWFKTEKFGDEKDRVVVKKDLLTTYFASDIAYHMEKFNRGFDRVIDVWGADHHGYIKRINASIDASGRKSDQFDVILVQLVNLLREGKPIAMSTRKGEFVTLKEIIDEVGKDATRFIFLSRSFDSKLDFDLYLAKQKTNENPVYYVQYVHARISSIISKAQDQGIIDNSDIGWSKFVSKLDKTQEIKLIKVLSLFPEAVEKSGMTLHPHVIFNYLMTLASSFHGYYNKHKIITDDRELSLGRLCLVSAVKIVVYNGLNLLGVSAPERM